MQSQHFWFAKLSWTQEIWGTLGFNIQSKLFQSSVSEGIENIKATRAQNMWSLVQLPAEEWHETTYYKEWLWLLGGNKTRLLGEEECQEHMRKQKDQLEGN